MLIQDHGAELAPQTNAIDVEGSLTVTVAGSTVTLSLPSVLTGTVDPSAGGGVAHGLPALYIRNNAGTTELWVASGVGATAWTQVTVP